MRKMRDELLTEITRASKMDRIKMTATLKKELAKSKEEQVSITETATATSSGDLAMDFSRVSQVWSLIPLSFCDFLLSMNSKIRDYRAQRLLPGRMDVIFYKAVIVKLNALVFITESSRSRFGATYATC